MTNSSKTLEHAMIFNSTLIKKNKKKMENFINFPFLKELTKFHEHKTHKYPELLHKIGIYLFLLGGRRNYTFNQMNLGLPSLSSVYKNIHTEQNYEEGTIRAEEFNTFLIERKLKKLVWLSEDATKIVERVRLFLIVLMEYSKVPQ